MATFKIGPKTRAEIEHKRDVAEEEAVTEAADDVETNDARHWRNLTAALTKSLLGPKNLLIIDNAVQAAYVATEIRNAADIARSCTDHRLTGEALARPLDNLERAIRNEFNLRWTEYGYRSAN